MVYSASANVAFVKILKDNISEKQIPEGLDIDQIADCSKKSWGSHGVGRG